MSDGNDSPPIILREFEPRVLRISTPDARAGTVYVLTLKDGTHRSAPQRLSAADRFGTRLVSVVDVAARGMTASFEADTSVEGEFFDANIDATWKVSDPITVVSRHMVDGAGPVLERIKSVVTSMTGSYEPKDVVLAEASVGAALTDPLVLDEGLSIINCRVRLNVHPDQIADARRALSDDYRLRQEHLQSVLEADEDSLLLLHLARDPEITAAVLKRLGDHSKRADDMFEILERLEKTLSHNESVASKDEVRDRTGGPDKGGVPSWNSLPVASERLRGEGQMAAGSEAIHREPSASHEPHKAGWRHAFRRAAWLGLWPLSISPPPSPSDTIMNALDELVLLTDCMKAQHGE